MIKIYLIALLLGFLSSCVPTIPSGYQYEKRGPQSRTQDNTRINSRQRPDLKRLTQVCSNLAKRNLRYQFGSNNPRRGGLDCSGTTQYVLQQMGYQRVPRTAYQQYQWLRSQRLVKNIPSYRTENFWQSLEPGQLIFWKGTYKTRRPISHVMIFMGIDPRSGKPIVFGGRSERARGLNGAGVDFFEFRSKLGHGSKIVATAKLPNFNYGRGRRGFGRIF